MRAPQHPLNQKRLATLNSLGVLDTAPEAEFDDLVELVSTLLDVPVALISLVDSDRQWFKARVGMELPETPIIQSVCSHAILGDGILEIEDTHVDLRTKDNSLMHEEVPLRFYAGAPLVAGNGMPLGTLCILDHKPRRLTELQRRVLSISAIQIVNQLELKRSLRNEETLRAEMDHRIKNSLQATSSLVRMYTRAVEDDAARDALKAVQRRIDAMSALHEQLQKTSVHGTVEARQYLADLMDSLQETTPDTIRLSHHSDEITMPSGAATDLGVIVSEFIANTIKHGFPDNTAGEVEISLSRTDDGKLVLHASDNGVGSAAAPAAPSRISGIGSSIVAAAASNLGGTLSNDLTPQGARLTLVFSEH